MDESGGMVYVVTSGEYSSYGIDGVYSTLEKAEAAAGRSDSVEWYALDEADGAHGPWHVRMRKTGARAIARRTQSPDEGSLIFTGRREAYFTVMARNEQQALKAANERRAFLIASGIWSEGEEPVQLTADMFADS